LGTRRAEAQACCAGSSANEFGIVARGSAGLVGLRLSEQWLPWTADASSDVTALEGLEARSTTLTLGGGFRVLDPRLQLQGTLPLVLQYRALEGTSAERAVGLGDAALHLRFSVLEDDTEGALVTGSWLPFLEPHLGVSLPTGRAPADAELPTGVDATGTGDVRLLVGLRASRFLTASDVVFLGFSAGPAMPRPTELGGETVSYRAGTELLGQLSYLHYLSPAWLVGLGVELRGTLESALDGESVEDSATRRVSVGLQLSHFLDWPSWQVRLGASLDPPLDGLQQGLSFAGGGVTLSVERHFAGPEPREEELAAGYAGATRRAR
jgi:hypothetical protein